MSLPIILTFFSLSLSFFLSHSSDFSFYYLWKTGLETLSYPPHSPPSRTLMIYYHKRYDFKRYDYEKVYYSLVNSKKTMRSHQKQLNGGWLAFAVCTALHAAMSAKCLFLTWLRHTTPHPPFHPELMKNLGARIITAL